jgi:hypothetical protein
MPKPARDLTGRRFGRLVVARYETESKLPRNRLRWECKCDCGSVVLLRSGALVSGNTRSCGCLGREARVQRVTHGETRSGHQSPEYRVYRGMLERCFNPKSVSYRTYGGRGITICPQWLGENGFAKFLKHVGRKPSPTHQIDRFPDTNGSYRPGNVRWATVAEQQRNRRSTILVERDGRTMCLVDWCTELGINVWTVYTRVQRGMDPNEALSRPIVPSSERWKYRLDGYGRPRK